MPRRCADYLASGPPSDIGRRQATRFESPSVQESSRVGRPGRSGTHRLDGGTRFEMQSHPLTIRGRRNTRRNSALTILSAQPSMKRSNNRIGAVRRRLHSLPL
jgi:hypothetical protein